MTISLFLAAEPPLLVKKQGLSARYYLLVSPWFCIGAFPAAIVPHESLAWQTTSVACDPIQMSVAPVSVCANRFAQTDTGATDIWIGSQATEVVCQANDSCGTIAAGNAPIQNQGETSR